MSARRHFRFEENWSELDADTFQLSENENARQLTKIILIAALSLCPRAVQQVMASNFSNIDAEGFPPLRMSKEELTTIRDARRQSAYYRRYSDSRANKSSENTNIIEVLAQRRLAQLFATDHQPNSVIKISADEIFVNVQPPTGAIANMAVLEALLEPGDTILAMALTHGGHLSHGSDLHRTGMYYRTIQYGVEPQTGRLDYDQIEELALNTKPKLVIAGASSYPWDIDWARLRHIVDKVPAKTYLMADIAHPAGLVVAGLFPNPVGYADVTTLVTYKTLCGPRGAAILTTDEQLAWKIDRAVFPGLQSSPILQNIAAMAVGFKIAQTEEFHLLQRRIVANAQLLASELQKRGMNIAYGGTNSHLVVVDLKGIPPSTDDPLSGDISARILDLAHIVCNKNVLPGDQSAATASGLRFGTTWISQLGLMAPEIEQLAEIIHLVLSNIQSFHYIGTSSRSQPGKADIRRVLRGKIAYDVLQEAKMEVMKLLQNVIGNEHSLISLPLNSSEPTHFVSINGNPDETSEHMFHQDRDMYMIGFQRPLSVLQISGERAKPFIQNICTANIFGAPANLPIRSFISHPDFSSFTEVIIFPLEQDGLGRDRFLVAVHADKAKQLLDWMQALSDGYVFFGHDDILAKIDGPVVLDILAPDINETRLGEMVLLSGVNVSRILGEIGVLPGDLIQDKWMSIGVADTSAKFIAFTQQQGSTELLALHIATNRRQAFSRSLERAATRRELSVPLWDPSGSQTPNATVKGMFEDTGGYGTTSYDPRKPFFIGQQLLDSRCDHAPQKPEFHYQENSTGARKTRLYHTHLELGAKMIAFAGWEMPVWYSRIADEYRAVRQTAALFDLGHMGVLEISGPDATWFLDAVTTNSLALLAVGESCYSLLLDPRGSVMDDCYLYRLEPQRYMMVVNAANVAKIVTWLRAVSTHSALIDYAHPVAEVLASSKIRDLQEIDAGPDRRMNIALQGPHSLIILQQLVDSPKQQRRLATLRRNQVIIERAGDHDLIIARTGYTGEMIGFELYVHPDKAAGLWTQLLNLGKPYGLLPAGLGARDAARIEAGFPLYGHELAGKHDISPIEAGYGAFVKFHKPFFIGRKQLLAREAQRSKEIIRFRANVPKGKMIRPGNPVVTARGQCIGFVTSCSLIESHQMGMAFVTRRHAMEGQFVGIYAIGDDGPGAPFAAVEHFTMGAKLPPYIEATVLPRFC